MGAFEKLKDAVIGGKSRAVLTEDLDDDTTDVLINVTKTRSISLGSTVTEHAVEDGAPITDNKKNNNIGISMDILLVDQLDLLTLASSLKSKKIPERQEQLKDWFKDSTILFYLFDQDFDSVVIQSYSENGSVEDGKGLSISLGLKQIIIAKADEAEGVQDKGSTEIQDDGNLLDL